MTLVGVRGAGPRLRAVLFDMDGTLLSNDRVWVRALQEYARARGGRLPAEYFARNVGLPGTEAVARAQRLLGLDPATLQADAEWVRDRVGALLITDPPHWLPGAKQLIQAVVAAGLPTALVTSSERSLVAATLRPEERAWFTVVVCGDDVTYPKPDPEPYRTAARALGVVPGDCVALEDSPSGLASARAAGCRVIAVGPARTNGHPAYDLRVPGLAAVDTAILGSLYGP
jgi:HAD superfamily hydrolase (TIGR01509 family)